MIQLLLQLTARVQPRPVKRLLEERGQCSKVVQLHERAQAAPRVIEKVDTMRTDRTVVDILAAKAAASNARIGVSTDNHNVAGLPSREHTGESGLIFVLFGVRGCRDRRIRRHLKQSLLPASRIFNLHTHCDNPRAYVVVHNGSSCSPRSDSQWREQDADSF